MQALRASRTTKNQPLQNRPSAFYCEGMGPRILVVLAGENEGVATVPDRGWPVGLRSLLLLPS